jgi:hypothetical protein
VALKETTLTRPPTGRAKSLRELDRKQIAVVIGRDRIQSVLRGIAHHLQISQEHLLQIRIRLDQHPGTPVFEIKESEWSGDIVRDDQYGCDYQLRLDAVA